MRVRVRVLVPMRALVRAHERLLNPVKLYNPPNAHLKHVLKRFSACLDKIFIRLNEAP